MGLGGDNSVEEYICKLNDTDKKRALDELREDDNIREQSLAQMRDWINKHPNIKKCRTGNIILLQLITNYVQTIAVIK